MVYSFCFARVSVFVRNSFSAGSKFTVKALIIFEKYLISWPKRFPSIFAIMADFESIPHHVFFYMQEWLQTKTKDYIAFNFGKKNNAYDDRYWRNFMNCNKALREVKKRTMYLKLNGKYSLKFVKDVIFRDLVLMKVWKPQNQIGLDLVNFKVRDPDLLPGIDGLNCVDLSFSNIKNVTMLNNVQTLVLSDCSYCSDFTTLSQMKTLDLTFCKRVQDTSSFGAIHYLDLSFCRSIRDVSSLGNVQTLKLSGCTEITDVSMLGAVYELDLSGCVGIIDVSNLGKVYRLNLAKCSKVKDIFGLGDNHILDLMEHKGDDFTSLRKVNKLKLSSCQNLKDLSILSEVKELDLSQSKKFFNLSCLVQLESLVLSNHRAYYNYWTQNNPENNEGDTSQNDLDISALIHLKSLTLRSKKLPKGTENLVNLRELTCDNMSVQWIYDELKAKREEEEKQKKKSEGNERKQAAVKNKYQEIPLDASSYAHLFQYIQNLNLREFSDMLPGIFSHIPDISLSNAYNFTNLTKKFANVKKLSLLKCSGLTVVADLPFLEELTVNDCENVENIKFSTLPLMKIMVLMTCKGLKNLNCVGNSLESITMENCSALKSLVIAENMTNMKSLRIFYGFPSMKLEIKSNLFEVVIISMGGTGMKLNIKKGIVIHSLVVDDHNDSLEDEDEEDEHEEKVGEGEHLPYEDFVGVQMVDAMDHDDIDDEDEDEEDDDEEVEEEDENNDEDDE
jgi:hypothetical protein